MSVRIVLGQIVKVMMIVRIVCGTDCEGDDDCQDCPGAYCEGDDDCQDCPGADKS